jgi:hypothetical protein
MPVEASKNAVTLTEAQVAKLFPPQTVVPFQENELLPLDTRVVVGPEPPLFGGLALAAVAATTERVPSTATHRTRDLFITQLRAGDQVHFAVL